MVVRKSVYTEWSPLELQGLSRETLIERSSALKFMLLLANNRFWSQHRLHIYVVIFADQPAEGRQLLSVNSITYWLSLRKKKTCFDRRFWLNSNNFFTDNYYKTIYGPVRTECTCCGVLIRDVLLNVLLYTWWTKFYPLPLIYTDPIEWEKQLVMATFWFKIVFLDLLLTRNPGLHHISVSLH